MRVTFCKMCEDARESDAGPGIHGRLISSVGVSRFPCYFPPLSLALEFEVAPSETGRPFDLEAILLDEDGKQVFNARAKRELNAIQKPYPGLWFETFKMPDDMIIEKAGHYRWDILVNGQASTSERLTFHLTEATPVAD